jgi:hypothetical protein
MRVGIGVGAPALNVGTGVIVNVGRSVGAGDRALAAISCPMLMPNGENMKFGGFWKFSVQPLKKAGAFGGKFRATRVRPSWLDWMQNAAGEVGCGIDQTRAPLTMALVDTTPLLVEAAIEVPVESTATPVKLAALLPRGWNTDHVVPALVEIKRPLEGLNEETTGLPLGDMRPYTPRKRATMVPPGDVGDCWNEVAMRSKAYCRGMGLGSTRWLLG